MTISIAPQAQAQSLESFGVLGGSTVTNIGPTVINGNVGVSPGSAITGFPPGLVNAPYTIYRTDAVAQQAQSDLTTAYNVLASRPTTADLTGVDLGGQTLLGGVYNFNGGAQLTGTVTLDGGGNPNAVFIFNIGSTLTTAAASSVALINGARAGNVFFRVGSSATLGATTAFQGQILALTSITLITGATVNCGALLARNGAVALDNNVINICPLATDTVASALRGGGSGTASRAFTARAFGVATAIDDYRARTGNLPFSFALLSVLSPAELDLALRQLSGEVGSAVAPAAMQSTNSFLNAVLGDRSGFSTAPQGVASLPPGSGGRRDAPFGQPGSPSAGDRGSVTALSYFPQAARAPSALDAFDSLPQTPAPRSNWTIWAGGYGGYSDTTGNAGQGSSSRMVRDAGFIAGVDFHLDDNSSFGVAGAVGGTGFSLSDGLSSGRSQDFQAAVFGSTQFEAAYLRGALSYGYRAMSTTRAVTLAGFDQYAASFGTHTVAAELEAGYNLGLLTPYAAVRAQNFSAPAYAETTQAGSSIFALNYDAQTATALRVEIGTRIGWTTDLGDDKQLRLQSSIAWAHDFVSGPAPTASFQALPGSRFSLAGAEGSADSLLLSAGAELLFDNGLSLAASVDSAFAQNSQSYAGKLKLGLSF
ncbi:ice-binding family protein [Devosia sp. YR412]|uniref:ice-binding family protein n=1 Tax=Devosia sp. YR412 TaxID=1881030 RepID=UPI000B81A48D|nr:ice-binding family protein [Devosia sp. YR412]